MKSHCKVGGFPLSNMCILSSSNFCWECQAWEQQCEVGCTRNGTFFKGELEWQSTMSSSDPLLSNEFSIIPFGLLFHGGIFGQLACKTEGLVFHKHFLVLFITASSKGCASWIQSLMLRCFRSSSMLKFHMLLQEFSSLHLCVVQLLCLSLNNSEQRLTNKQLPSACCILASNLNCGWLQLPAIRAVRQELHDIDISLMQLFKCKYSCNSWSSSQFCYDSALW